MKKVILSALVAVSLVALAATPEPKGKSTCAYQSSSDTVPGKKKDTTKPIPDSIFLKKN